MWKKLLLGLVAVYVCFSLFQNTRLFWYDYQGEQWRQQAEQAVTPTWTEDDALTWLRQQGYEPLWQGSWEHQALGKADEHGFLVGGGYQTAEGNWLLPPVAFNVTFRFDLDHRPVRVDGRTREGSPGFP